MNARESHWQLAAAPELNTFRPNGLSRREKRDWSGPASTNKEIGRLNLSEHTIKNHMYRIFRNVGVRDRKTMVERCLMNAESVP